MSGLVMREVFARYEAASVTEYLLALYLAQCVDGGGRVLPPLEAMVAATRRGRRAVAAALATMRRSGWLREEPPLLAGMRPVYRIDPDWLAGGSPEPRQ